MGTSREVKGAATQLRLPDRHSGGQQDRTGTQVCRSTAPNSRRTIDDLSQTKRVQIGTSDELQRRRHEKRHQTLCPLKI